MCLSLFEWASYRRARGGVKLHVLLRHVPLRPASIVVMDRGDDDDSLFGRWTAYSVIERRPVAKNRSIVSDEIIRLVNLGADEKCPHDIRRVVVFDPEKQREIVLLTNHLESGATTIPAIYEDRWTIELFFKALDQNLRVKTFVGTTENALRIQIRPALRRCLRTAS